MKLIPGVSPLTEPYWAGAQRGELLLQRCAGCRRVWHPPLPRCPVCHSEDITWQAASGRGTVYTFTVVYHATHVALAEKVPYITALIQLQEGPRVLTNLRNCSEAEAHVGMPVRLIFEPLTDEITLPQFEPVRP
jgi:uncharacterized OB-fold protein